MAKSFFERLTGSVRTGDISDKLAEEDKVSQYATLRSKKKTDAIQESEKVIHPVGDKASENSPALEEDAEEGQLTVDIYDDGPYIVIQSTVAGVKPEDIDISLQEETLTIRGSRARADEVKEDSFYYRELYWGSFSRSIILPEEVDFSKAEASLKNGFLTVRLPKKDKGEKKLKVRVG